MKSQLTIIVAMFIVVGLGATPSIAAECIFLPSSGVWLDEDNWDECDNEYPKAGDSATIPNGKTCAIFQSSEAADWIDVQAGAELRIDAGSTLTIDEDSTVDGLLRLMTDVGGGLDSLLIAADVTISGDGGEIRMDDKSVIDDDGTSDWRLTLESSDPNCPDGDRSCSLVVNGTGGDIKVTLTNNAFVIAEGFIYGCWGNSPLVLSDNPKKGDGYWIAEEDGFLQVDADVCGPGRWQIVDTHSCASQATIQINATGMKPTGPVELTNGIFEVNETFTTCGDLTWASTGGGSGTSPKIKVADGRYVRFGSVCAMCPAP